MQLSFVPGLIFAVGVFVLWGSENQPAGAAATGAEELQIAPSVWNDPEATPLISDETVRKEIRRLSRGSVEFGELPESDREWVVQKAALGFFMGEVPYADLLRHIEELSSVRKLTIAEREIHLSGSWNNSASQN